MCFRQVNNNENRDLQIEITLLRKQDLKLTNSGKVLNILPKTGIPYKKPALEHLRYVLELLNKAGRGFTLFFTAIDLYIATFKFANGLTMSHVSHSKCNIA